MDSDLCPDSAKSRTRYDDEKKKRVFRSFECEKPLDKALADNKLDKNNNMYVCMLILVNKINSV